MKLGLLENSVNLAAVLKSFSKGHESGAVDRAICSTAQPLKNRARNFIEPKWASQVDSSVLSLDYHSDSFVNGHF